MLNYSRMTASRLQSLKFSPLKLCRCDARLFSAISLPNITNEPFLHYAPGSVERHRVLAACRSAREECPDRPLVINGQSVRTGDVGRQVFMQKVPVAPRCPSHFNNTSPELHRHRVLLCTHCCKHLSRSCPVSTATHCAPFTAPPPPRFTTHRTSFLSILLQNLKCFCKISNVFVKSQMFLPAVP